SSRRRHTRSTRDWSSDVCSSDLLWEGVPWRALNSFGAAKLFERFFKSPHLMQDIALPSEQADFHAGAQCIPGHFAVDNRVQYARSEERRVGKGCRSAKEAGS